MKKNLFLIACFAGAIAGIINGCKKDAVSIYNHGAITKSFTEEFVDVSKLTEKGWVITDNTSNDSGSYHYTQWEQGISGTDKSGAPIGFPAYSYGSSPDEYAYSQSFFSTDSNHSVSSWLITPVLSVKNGDKISFYTRGDADNLISRMQVLMNKSSAADVGSSSNSTGGFNTVLYDIDSSQILGNYPSTWTKYEYTLSGISGNIETRIAFRNYFINTSTVPGGVAIDQFKFEVK